MNFSGHQSSELYLYDQVNAAAPAAQKCSCCRIHSSGIGCIALATVSPSGGIWPAPRDERRMN
ncbi:MAG: hypothetical protein WCN98_12520, partial [Verrucomicrobiaceae bacterium]